MMHEAVERRNQSTFCRTSTRLLAENVERRGIVAPRGVTGTLSPGLVTRLIRVPQLTAVVAELSVTALAATAQLRTLRAAIRYHCITTQTVHLSHTFHTQYAVHNI